jgi:hypothetical protein
MLYYIRFVMPSEDLVAPVIDHDGNF